MEEQSSSTETEEAPNSIPESPKPLAFTIDFGEGKVDKVRHKQLMEKSHKRQLSVTEQKKERLKNKSAVVKSRDDLSLPLKNSTVDRMTQSCKFPCVSSPEVEKRECLSPEVRKIVRCNFECDTKDLEKELFTDCKDFDLDKSDNLDNVSDAGTYTLDADNYSEDQKARMSIDREFKIEQVSVLQKTEDYINSLDTPKEQIGSVQQFIGTDSIESVPILKPQTLDFTNNTQKSNKLHEQKQRLLSPILSPTQNLSITQNNKQEITKVNNDDQNKIFSKIMFPSPKSKTGIGSEPSPDHGSVISVTSSGAFRSRNEKKRHVRHLSLSKSGVQVEAYTESGFQNEMIMAPIPLSSSNLTASVVHVTDNYPKPPDREVRRSSFELGVIGNKLTNVPLGGKGSPTKIPSPIHTSRPRSRNSTGSTNFDLSDSSLETESYLKPTQNIIDSLQQRLSLDNDRELDAKYLNNDARNLLKKPTHLRHNSFDDRNLKVSNKLEHFQSKNLQGIDQTYTNVLNQYKVNKIRNSPNNSPIRRSSSFSTKNQINMKNFSKETNLINSPNVDRNPTIQRSSSTANIKPNLLRPGSDHLHHHQKIDRTIYGDTESSSEEDYDKNSKIRKDITNTRYNRAFSLRRARLDEPPPKCPNTPEMRRKFPGDASQRAISVDRKPTKTNDVPSRYLQSVAKKAPPLQPPAAVKPETLKALARPSSAGKATSNKAAPVFSRTDSGRYSMRGSKPPTGGNTPKNSRKDPTGKNKSGGRSNSSLSSREVEFQNWKRRKSYDPMKAAAEGKRKAELARKQTNMTQSYTEGNQDYDSSPSHSSSVHRSQSFHGTAALEQLISSDEEDQTLSADEGFSPPTPSPCELSPARASLRSIMTGDDSPTPNRKDEFNFGRSTPPPTTSYYPKQDYVDIKTVAEPNKEDKERDKEKDKEKDNKEKDDKDDIDMPRPDANPGEKTEDKKDDDKGDRRDGDKGDKGGRKDDKDGISEKKCNGDRLDGQWVPSSDSKSPPSDDEEDGNCAVKCLYYTMQCCECSIS